MGPGLGGEGGDASKFLVCPRGDAGKDEVAALGLNEGEVAAENGLAGSEAAFLPEALAIADAEAGELAVVESVDMVVPEGDAVELGLELEVVPDFLGLEFFALGGDFQKRAAEAVASANDDLIIADDDGLGGAGPLAGHPGVVEKDLARGGVVGGEGLAVVGE